MIATDSLGDMSKVALSQGPCIRVCRYPWDWENFRPSGIG